MNIFRSIEAADPCHRFRCDRWTGTFAGMIAITIHTVAALGKLYSELIEGIDPGPVEAIRATGANWLNTIRYGVIPQIVPPFAALTIYRWDINVRTSTIIGFVGGGGIGFWLWQFIINCRLSRSRFLSHRHCHRCHHHGLFQRPVTAEDGVK